MAAITPLEELGYPLFHEVQGARGVDLSAPSPRIEQAQRARVRHLQGMQKEALVTSSLSGTTWRLVSDEGDYLDGDDVAPCPLAFLTTGMVCSCANEIQALAGERGIDIRDLTIVQDNYYTMTGSALRGDMTGGALDPELDVRIDADADEATLHELVADAVESAPVTGLLRRVLENEFALALNGERLSPDRVADLDAPQLADDAEVFEDVPRGADAGGRDTDASERGADEAAQPLGRNTGRLTEEFTGDRSKYTGGASSSLASEQDRVLHLRGTMTLRDDGLKSVEVELYSPQGSIFEMLSEELEGHGGRERAPDAATYLAAGIGFCFMTQFGRYADIVDKELSDYRIVQNTHFSGGAASVAGANTGDGAGSVEPARAAPVETHVFLRSPEGEAFARDVLDMSEQTCFLHALCRMDLVPEVEVTAA